MKDKKTKYAMFLLKRCLSMNPCEPLLLSYNTSQKEFAHIVKEVAMKMGITKIYEVVSDGKKTREILINSSLEEISRHPYFDRSIINEVYKKGGSLLSLCSYEPSELKDVDPDKKNAMNKFKVDSQADAVAARYSYKYPWCIAAVATKVWADEIFPNEDDNLDKLWNLIFEITLMNKDNPEKAWDEKIQINDERKKILNELKLKTLKYKNSLGTNLELELPDNAIWYGTSKKDFYNKKDLLVNIPTEEVFTTPNRNKVNGTIVSSRPLEIRGALINKFEVTFKDGKAVKIKASNNEEKLLELLEQFDGMKYLGECALVDYNSPISKTNLMFKNILIDENASCHLAFGSGFSIAIPGGGVMTEDDLLKNGINQSKNHIDFMIGTKDLSIIGTDIYKNKIPIFIDGNFAEEKIKKFIKERNEK